MKTTKKGRNLRTPHTDIFVEELKFLLKPRGRKASLCLYLAKGEETRLAGWRTTIQKILLKKTASPAAETAFEIQAWAKANHLPVPHRI